mmetsp:Transcript_8489/g.18999  ORF Transcript_8489/g.18999 Transcript_8489/m.18999 type:complete len:903 (+) Transcript_8489:307-3015(+)
MNWIKCKNVAAATSLTILVSLSLLLLLSAATFTNKSQNDTLNVISSRVKRALYAWQTATPYSDPNNLCAAGATGHRATPGCGGYVFCNNGYLMGGGSSGESIGSVLPCNGGQLYNEGVGQCQSGYKCPTSAAPPPPSKPKPNPPPPPPSKPKPNPPRNPPPNGPNPQPNPKPSTMGDLPPGAPSTARPPSNPTDSSSASNTKNELPKFMSDLDDQPSRATPRPTRKVTRQPTRAVVIAQKPAASLMIDSFSKPQPIQPRPPTPYPTRKPPTKRPLSTPPIPQTKSTTVTSVMTLPGIINVPSNERDLQSVLVVVKSTIKSNIEAILETGQKIVEIRIMSIGEINVQRRGRRYDLRYLTRHLQQGGTTEVEYQAVVDYPCKQQQSEDCDAAVDAILEQVTAIAPALTGNNPAAPTINSIQNKPVTVEVVQSPNNEPNYGLTNNVYLYGTLRSSYYCAVRWGDWSVDTCNMAMPCSSGLHSECLGGQNCFPGTPCASLRTPRSPTPKPTPRPVSAVAEITPSQSVVVAPSPPMTMTTNSNSADVAMYQNPEGNQFFCGMTYVETTEQCSQGKLAKPCPNGIRSMYCSEKEGCFLARSCTTEYASAARQSITTTNATPAPKITTMQSKPQPTEMLALSQQQATTTNTNFCGVSWQEHIKVCANSLPCPKGDECPVGETCFHASPCANNPDNVESTPEPEIAKKTPVTSAEPTQPISPALLPDEANMESKSSTPVVSGEVNQNPPISSEASSQTQPVLETCSLCGDSTLDESQYVNLDGNGLHISCSQFGYLFSSQSIFEGSEKCLNYRGQYSDKCCNIKQDGDGGSHTISYISLGLGSGVDGGSQASPPTTMSSTTPPMSSTTPKPPTEEPNKWRTMPLLAAPASALTVSIWACCLSVAVGLLVV